MGRPGKNTTGGNPSAELSWRHIQLTNAAGCLDVQSIDSQLIIIENFYGLIFSFICVVVDLAAVCQLLSMPKIL